MSKLTFKLLLFFSVMLNAGLLERLGFISGFWAIVIQIIGFAGLWFEEDYCTQRGIK